MIKLFVSDLDGTLFNSKGELSEKTIEAIKRFQESGGTFMVGTGRDLWDTDQVSSRIDNVVYNCAHGAAMYNSNHEAYFKHKLDRSDLLSIEMEAIKYDVPVMFHGTDRIYVTTDLDVFVSRAKDTFRKSFPEELLDSVANYFINSNMSFGVNIQDILNKDILNAEICFIRENDHKRLYERIKSLLKDVHAVSSDFMMNIEITSKDAGKDKAVVEYSMMNGIDINEIVVIGDSENDVEMLSYFNNSFAMKNGVKEAKDAAKYLADSNDEDGVANLLNKICDDNMELIV